MASESPTGGEAPLRNQIALWILAASAVAITLLAVTAIVFGPDDKSNAMTIFNITLPVFSSWVGTVLAFYFGRDNFESANAQVRQMINKLSPEERAAAPISSIMRRLDATTHVKLAAADGEKQLTVKALRDLMVGDASRLPVVDAAKAPKYMIHASLIDRFKAEGGQETDTLAAFIADAAARGTRFDAGRGYVLAAATDTIAAAKARLEQAPSCQDIFVTATGKPGEPMVGWVSNVRLSKFLQA